MILLDLSYLSRCLLCARNLFPGQNRWGLPPHSLCCISPLGTDAINVPGFVQDVPLHERFPCWCCLVISSRVHNIIWLQWFPTMCSIWEAQHCPVSQTTHTAKLWCSSTPKAVATDGANYKEPFALPHQVLFEYFKRKEILYQGTFTWLQSYAIKPQSSIKNKEMPNTWMKQLVTKVNFHHIKIQIPCCLMKWTWPSVTLIMRACEPPLNSFNVRLSLILKHSYFELHFVPDGSKWNNNWLNLHTNYHPYNTSRCCPHSLTNLTNPMSHQQCEDEPNCENIRQKFSMQYCGMFVKLQKNIFINFLLLLNVCLLHCIKNI